MSFLAGPGAIVVEAALVDEHVRALAIRSSRPAGLGRVFIGQPGEEVPALAERVFTLCGFSHRVAAAHAIASARRCEISSAARFDAGIGLLAERIEDSLRSMLLGWPHRGNMNGKLTEARGLFRQAGAQTQKLLDAARAGRCFTERKRLSGLLQDLQGTLTKLGVGRSKLELVTDDFFGGLAADARDEKITLHQPDTLETADDRDVVAALAQGGEGFAALPALPGRIIETGSFARCWRDIGESENAMLARLNARMEDIMRAEGSLRASLEDGRPLVGLVETEAFDDGAYAAVESPRGRLYHRVALGQDGRIKAYDLLAPTEWNLHPQGPLNRSLLGAHVGAGEEARLRIGRLTALFDPCVAFRVECQDAGHA